MKHNFNSRENFIYGRNPVKEALNANKVVKVYISESLQDKQLISKIQKNNNVVFVTNNELDKICSGASHQGIAACIKPYEYLDLQSLIKLGKSQQKPVILMLDGINDPQNFGAIIRCADIFGINGIIISKHNQVLINSTVAKTSAGAINYIPITLVNNLNQAISSLKQEGYWVVSSDGSASLNYCDIKYDFPTVLVIGSEGFGISNLILKNSDYVVKIPMHGKVNSLNASVATGVLLAEICK